MNETKQTGKQEVRDLTPKKDAKGGHHSHGPKHDPNDNKRNQL